MPGLFNPVSLLLNGLGAALQHALGQLTGWAFTQMIAALQATTTVRLDGWFAGPWRAMASVAVLLAIPLLLAGVTTEVWHGNPTGALRRGLLMPLLVGVGLLAAPPLLSGLLSLVDAICTGLLDLALGGPAGYTHALQLMGVRLGVLSNDALSAAGLPGPVVVLLSLIVGVLAFVIWIELALRTALIYLLAVLIPLAAAGLFWRATTAWTRRLLETLLAVALSKVLITAVMVLATSALTSTPATAAGSVDDLATGLALLLLGTFALPMTMRLVPHVADATVAAGAGAAALRRVRSGAALVGTTVAGVAGPSGIGLAGAALAGPSMVARLAASRTRSTGAVPLRTGPSRPATGRDLSSPATGQRS